MSYEFLRQLLARRPFEPFSLHLSNGEAHEVRSPECALLTKSRIAVADLDADKMLIVSLLHITKVEMLHAASGLH